MNTLATYVPMDRCQALACGRALPERAEGAVLFADLVGLPSFIGALIKELGVEQGAVELTHQLDYVYDLLISEIERYGGSVISSGGDTLICWFDGDTGLRAVAAGLMMQQELGKFAALQSLAGSSVTLRLRVGIASGPVRRFVAGSLQRLDLIAGAALERAVEVAEQAHRGEVLLDGASARRLANQLSILTLRPGDVVVVGKLIQPVEPHPWPALAENTPPESELRPWLLPFISRRWEAGEGEFPTELRTVVPCVLRFEGIDYEGDPRAGEKVERYLSWVQELLARYEGTLLEVTLGRAGSYLYIVFGVPYPHEDDPTRAALAAWTLRNPPAELAFVTQVQIGVSKGLMRIGAYGSRTRRAYGVMGEEVNLAIRLMQDAAHGEVLVSGRIHAATTHRVRWHDLPALRVRGLAEPLPIFYMGGLRSRQTVRLLDYHHEVPMVGREVELNLIRDRLSRSLAGQGQIVGITGEAGMGKSRLMAEVLAMARAHSVVGYTGECHASGTATPYLVWQPIWHAFFGLDDAWSPTAKQHALERDLAQIDPGFVARVPLLDQLLNLPIPDNELTRWFDPPLRKASREALLIDALRARATHMPLLFILDDLHWIDPLSRELLEAIGHAISRLPVLIVLAYRPPESDHAPDVAHAPWLGLHGLPHFTEIHLPALSAQEAERLMALKLLQIGQALEDPPPAPDPARMGSFVQGLTQRAQGNPFYIEEWLNLLHDRGLDPRNAANWQLLELPDSVHGLILRRLEQVSPPQRAILEAASVIGRLFRFSWLVGYAPELGSLESVRAELNHLHRLDLTPLEIPSPELTYVFKHILMREVVYHSLPEPIRAQMHERLALYLESQIERGVLRDVPITLLAYHYGRSKNQEKQRRYLRLAGEAAQGNYDNLNAIAYYERLLPLLDPATCPERAEVLLQLGTVVERGGQWARARHHYLEALGLAEGRDALAEQARCQLALGTLLEKEAAFEEAVAWLERARSAYEQLGDRAGVGQSLTAMAQVFQRQGSYALAQGRLEEGVRLAEGTGDQGGRGSALYLLGVVAQNQDDPVTARRYLEEALRLAREVGDKRGIARALSFLGAVVLNQERPALARRYLEESLALLQEIGDRRGIASIHGNLGFLLYGQEALAEAHQHLELCLQISRELGDLLFLAYALVGLGAITLQVQPGPTTAWEATRLAAVVDRLLHTLGAVLEPYERAVHEQGIARARSILNDYEFSVAWSEGKHMMLEEIAIHPPASVEVASL